VSKPAEISDQFSRIPLDQIVVKDRSRLVIEDRVDVIIATVPTTGDINVPITVRKIKGAEGQFALIDGAHRIRAAERLGMERIIARILPVGARVGKLIEVEANLSGAQLSPLDRALSMADRKRAYLKLHPETAPGTAGASARWNATETISFASYMSKITGLTERKIRMTISAAERLTKDEARWLQNAPKKVTEQDLIALGKEGDAHKRSQAIIALSNGEVKSVKAALAARAKNTPVKDPISEAHLGLLKAFNRAPKEAQRRFVQDVAAELVDLMPSRDGNSPADVRGH